MSLFWGLLADPSIKVSVASVTESFTIGGLRVPKTPPNLSGEEGLGSQTHRVRSLFRLLMAAFGRPGSTRV